MALLYLEDIAVGDTCRAGPYRVTEREIIDFATEWDPQPFHLDAEAAAASVFGRISACSAHIFALCCKLSMTLEDDTASMAALGFQEMKMTAPVYGGDDIRLVGVVEECRRSRTKPDRGIVHSLVRLLNQHGETVFSMSSASLVRARELATDPAQPNEENDPS